MERHRVYYGFLKNPHYFVEVRKDLYDEWNVQDVRNITHKDIVKWRLKERGSKSKHILMHSAYFKRGCGDTVKLLKIIKRKESIGYVYKRS